MKKLFIGVAVMIVSLSFAYASQAVDTGSPDLAVSSGNITITPTILKEGITATFKAKIENTGSSTASAIKVRFFIGQNLIGEKIINTLGKNSSSYSILPYKIPVGMVGEQTLRVSVDSDNTIAEIYETNNVAEKIFTVLVNKPDLLASSTDITVKPDAYKMGDKITVTAKIKNIGTALATGVKIRWVLNGATINEKTNVNIGASATYSHTFVYQLPATLAGEQNLQMVLDPDNTIVELFEDNNQVVKVLNIGSAYVDLSAIGSDITYSKSSPKPGEKVLIKGTINNLGNIMANNVFGYILVDGKKVFERKMTIPAGKKDYVSFNYTIPTSAMGALGVEVKADPTNLISETNEENNVGTSTLKLNSLNIDLDVASGKFNIIPADKTIIAGRTFTLKGAVKNIGLDKSSPTTLNISLVKYEKVVKAAVDKDEMKKFIARLKKNKMSARDINRAVEKKYGERINGKERFKRVLTGLGTVNIPALNANQTFNVSKLLTLPANYDLSEASLEITVDPDKKVYEINRSNNYTIITFPTRPKSFDASVIDMQITHTPANQSIMAGQNAYIKATINNNGTENITGLKADIYLNTKPQIEGATKLATQSVNAIFAGKTATVNYTFKIPAGAQDNQIIIIYLDPANVINESDEANNVAYHTIPVNPQTRDLVVTSILPSINDPKVGQAIVWKVKVKNNGNQIANNFSLGVFTDINSDQPTLTKAITALGAGSEQTYQFNWTVPANLAYALNYPVKVTADYLNQINEINEQNNTGLYNLTLKVPDLSADQLGDLAINHVYKGKSFIWKLTVHNTNVISSGASKAALYYYISGQNNSALTRLADVDLGVINKNETKVYQQSARLPDTIAVGANIGFAAIVDLDNAVLELNENNNKAEITKTVEEPPRQVQYPAFEVNVVDNEYNNLNNATVKIVNKVTGVTETKITGTETFYYSVGAVMFESRPSAADYTVTVSAPGWRTQTLDFNYASDEIYDPSIVDWRRYSLEVVMDKKALIAGRITGNGSPLSWTVVNVLGTDIGATTDANGDYKILINGGSYTLKFTHDGYARTTQAVTAAPMENLVVNKELPVTTVGYFSGLVTNDEGAGLANVDVYVNDIMLGVTGADGQFNFDISAGIKKFKFQKPNYVALEVPNQDIIAGHEYAVYFTMYPPVVNNRAERGATFVSWHQSVCTPANSYFIPEYNVDVWWGIGNTKMGLDYTGSGASTKLTKLTVKIKGNNWECHKVEGDGGITVSGIDVPITIAAGGCYNQMTKVDVYKVAIVSDNAEVWVDESFWTNNGPDNIGTKTFTLNNLAVNWNNDFQIRVWFRVQKKDAITGEGEGSGALNGYYLDRKMVTWRPAKPPTSSISTSWGQIGGYLLGILDNPVSAVTSFTDLFTIESYNQYDMQEVMPNYFPGYIGNY